MGCILLRAGFDEETVVAGILHDVVEDTPRTLADIQKLFGTHVAEIVAAVSENKTLPWHKRKEVYLQNVLVADSSAKAVSIADKLHNVSSMNHDLAKGRDIWKHFSQDKHTTVEHYVHFVHEIKKH
ncbi:MAG: hypothetical protein A3I44_05380 [Candidatus Sungbacteria bacterium RIFCSPLOWO2_02_FULL_51_17]|uniref:HD/PDEase domain-containing protein n=1 Tax=Candidatus Sungbacteria bacterium RIFCSPHIGHO2_02_FULL_51_29 TaxID=1802273 RepID=A0A1G2KQW3_9BACT|nr:MAG: hypothetical protein A3C16_04410 [Candidatus Sungbacteria bacterium RIFCSPHIGHO2_02_FULL_51_29]OHA04540.1 MAG: hypothetical protein A3B29_00045 [Candidatus Sungbacteria bacterium RIFCSPLOWO2_01_FULL_51_34]OHA10548.1 MAG: hypothetical protein A3I44_05380 [Candidatus Sungbacteria bacterium RIFCSPLOWO2_02_FULL_51_17]